MLLHAIADPLFLALAGLAAAGLLALLGFRRLGLLLAIAAGLGLYLVSTPLVAGRLLASLEPPPLAEPALGDLRPAAIVVLSANLRRGAPEFGPESGGETVGDLTLERMRYGALLQRRTGLPVLVTGGRLGGSRRSVARLMAEAFEADYGIAVRWVEKRARDTFENAVLSRRILEAEGIDQIYLVTHAWHMPRAVAAFVHVGFQVVPAPTGFTRVGLSLELRDLVPRASSLATSAYAFHEWLGRLWYELALL